MLELKGLSTQEAKTRLKNDGPNALPLPHHRFIKLVFRQLKGIINVILIVAAIITFTLGEVIDSGFILFYVVLGTSLNVFQEYRSNQAALKLKDYLRSKTTVIRDQVKIEIDTQDLVVGDLLELHAGDIVPADAVIVKSNNVMADESSFTGESVSVTKTAVIDTLQNPDKESNLLQGVIMVSGIAFAQVTATGVHTQLAKISLDLSKVDSQSELVADFDRISKMILKITLVTVVFVVIANMLIEGPHTDVIRLVIFAIALAVSAIPEALPLVLTFSLSHGAMVFSKNGVIVKRLSAVHDLGSVNLLCTDKTGTLTENHLRLINSMAIPNFAYEPLVLSRLASSDLYESSPQPFDRASDEALSEAQRKLVTDMKFLEEEAFDPMIRCNGAFVQDPLGKKLHIKRGSPDYFIKQGLIKESDYTEWLHQEETQGHRVLGVSCDEGDGDRFGGFLSFEDALKDSTTQALAMAKAMNVKVTIITGDANEVTLAVAKKTGLVSDDSHVIDTTRFFELPLNKQEAQVGDIRAFTRANPKQKLDLIELLKKQYSVGYLGDGINDAAALKSAHVSMVVESAADVARETADIVLLKKDLRVIIVGIRLGRETHANTMKYVRGTLVSNFGNFYSVAIASLLISFLPMLPKQLLMLNLLSDFPMMAIAFDKVPKEEIAYPQKINMQSLFTIILSLAVVSTFFDFIFFALFYRISPQVLQTNWFIGSVLTEILFIFSIRTFLPITKAGLPAPLIMGLMLTSMAITIALPMIPWTADFFNFTPPPLDQLFIIIGLCLLYLVVSELVKYPIYKHISKQK